jgi:hypothetical protein
MMRTRICQLGAVLVGESNSVAVMHYVRSPFNSMLPG